MKQTRTPTETLIAAMEEVNGATECLVIMTNGNDGSILVMGTTSALSTRLGMLEMSKALILKDMILMEES